MRKMMEAKVEELMERKKKLAGNNSSLKSKYQVISNIEKEVYEKLIKLDEESINKINQLENELTEKNNERLEFEALNRMSEAEKKDNLSKHIDLNFEIDNNAKMEEMAREDFLRELSLLEDMIKTQIKEYEEINSRMKEQESKSMEDPVIKIEMEKNLNYKKKIDDLEKALIEASILAEENEIRNDYLTKKKEDILSEKKKLISLNEELKREIEQKTQLYDMRIQKKVKDNNSEDIQKLDDHFKKVEENIVQLEGKIDIENDKTKSLSKDVLRYQIELRHKEERKKSSLLIVDERYKEIDDLKDKLEDLKEQHSEINEKMRKAETDNQLHRNRNKILAEEHASIISKLNYMSNNYDTQSNIQKISMEDMKVLTQTNQLVNDSINNFVTKVGGFKNIQIPRAIYELDREDIS